MIQLYNTLTRKKEIFEPLEEKKVKMYVCGPTVYNYIHIGNARSVAAFDTIRRYLEYRGYKVHYVSNFTDVDDKIIRVANELKISAPEVAERFITAFKEDTAALNIQPACDHPRVLNYMPEIIDFISILIRKGYAYEVAGDVYYRTRKFSSYGQLSHQSIDELEIGASQRTGAEQQRKEDPLDFTLWKAAKNNEISWDSPWGKGRPGWHIECSVMATHLLGDTIDIHGGGQDLEFPHHENEIAQSESKTNQTFAKYWMHNGYVTTGEEDEKMSKSLGNFITVHELKEKIDPQVLRFFLTTTSYRKPLKYSEAMLAEAETNFKKLKGTYEGLQFRIDKSIETLPEDAEHTSQLEQVKEQFIQEMDDDFNTANGMTMVYELAKWLNQYMLRTKVSRQILQRGISLIEELLDIFGIVFQVELLDEAVEKLIEERKLARQEKNFSRSDEIRELLSTKGILLEDTAQGTRWKRTT